MNISLAWSAELISIKGPATLLIDFAIMGVMIFNVVYALGELAVMYPVSGGFYTYSTRFIDASWGFAMGWSKLSCTVPRSICSNESQTMSSNGPLSSHSNLSLLVLPFNIGMMI